MKSGIFYRICRDGKWKAVDITEMTHDEIAEMLKSQEGCNADYPIKLIMTLCQVIAEIEVLD